MEDVLDQFKFKKGVMKLYEELVTLIYERNEDITNIVSNIYEEYFNTSY